MGPLTIIAVIIVGVLELILFFKVWRMCNDVKTITKAMPRSQSNIGTLVYLRKTNPMEFERQLELSIYEDLMASVLIDGYKISYDDRDYIMAYADWRERLDYLGWEFPETFRELDTLSKFCEAFGLPKR